MLFPGYDLGRTEEYISNVLKNKANICLICIETIKRVDAVSVVRFLLRPISGIKCNAMEHLYSTASRYLLCNMLAYIMLNVIAN